MRIDFKKLKTLPVETVSGQMLGHVHDVEIEVETHLIVQYRVRSSLLRTKTYLINRLQVVEIAAEKIIVDDGIVNEAEDAAMARKESPEITPKPIAMREPQM